MEDMRLGVIDLGSNSFHLLVADRGSSGDLHHVAREKMNLRLGDVVARGGYFHQDACLDAIEAVRRLRDIAIEKGAGVVFGAATSAFRDAANGAHLLRQIEAETGVNVRLIDGREEGRLVFEAVQSSVRLPAAPAVCLDLGGGSLEVVVGDEKSIQWAESLPLGVVRLKAQLLADDPPSRAKQRRLVDHVASVIAGDAGPALQCRPRLMIGAGGTFRSIARMVAGQRDSTIPASINEMTVEREELLELSEMLLRLPMEERILLPGVGRRRADLAPAGVLIVTAAMDAFGIDRITVAEWTLKEGLIIDAATKALDPSWVDPAGPLTLALRHGVDLQHAAKVSRIATQFFDCVAQNVVLAEADGRLLANAALLHEIGRSRTDDGHHKAGARIVLDEFPSGPCRQRDELACLIRFQNSSTPKSRYEPYRALPTVRQDVVAILHSVLRVADWLADAEADVTVDAAEGGIGIEVPSAYSAAAIWELAQRAQAVERLVGCKVGIRRVADELELLAGQRN